MSAKDKQVGGGHYKDMPIQPIDFIVKNGLSFIEGCIVKYISRWRSKGGVEDLRKVIHYAELLIEAEEGAKVDTAPAEAAIRTLERLGWNHRGGVEWAPPLGKPPAFVNQGPKGDTAGGPFEWPLRACTCQGSNPSDPDYQCQCPPVLADCHCPPDKPLDAQNRVPAADSLLPPVVVPEGRDWPSDAENGTRVLCWRPRKPGDPGTHLYGWVEVGFMWDGRLVPYAVPF